MKHVNQNCILFVYELKNFGSGCVSIMACFCGSDPSKLSIVKMIQFKTLNVLCSFET
jgi:hypothetical protein